MAENGSPLQEANVPAGLVRRRRAGLYVPFALFALFCVGWTGFWFFSADLATKIADNFILREAERGREWACPQRNVGGFPFRIEISCVKPHLVLKGGVGEPREGSLGGLVLNARILSPGHFIAVLRPPFVARQGSLGEMELNWTSARASLRAGTESISEVSVEIADASMSAGAGDRQDIKALAKIIELHLRRSPGEVSGTDLVARIHDLTFAPLDHLTGTADPVRIEFQASAPGLLPDPKRRFQDVLEQWRLSGHKARVIVFKATKGSANIDLAGEMRLDSVRRLEGNLQGRARGLDALTGRLTRRGGVDVGGLLGKLSGGQGLPVALSFENGWVRFGPIPLVELTPLY